jgi:GNAT superfamily N-acetyltransferase
MPSLFPLAATRHLTFSSVVRIPLGVIKRARPYYASGVAKSSGEQFPANAPELGYIAVDPEHQGKGLSGRLVAVLMSDQPGFVFATTSNDLMKKTLAKAGFVRKGKEWKGKTGALSLWTRG